MTEQVFSLYVTTPREGEGGHGCEHCAANKCIPVVLHTFEGCLTDGQANVPLLPKETRRLIGMNSKPKKEDQHVRPQKGMEISSVENSPEL